MTFFNRLRSKYPDTWGVIGYHQRNEGKRAHSRVSMEKAEGMTTGASDIIIPGAPAFVCELKRRDHTVCRLSEDQEKYLLAAQRAGAFVCVALGADAAWEAFHEYLSVRKISTEED